MSSSHSEIIKAELLRIKAIAANDMLYPHEVVRLARSPKSPLHNEFEWNDKIAGHEHRLNQARRLIVLHVRHANGEPMVLSLTHDRVRGGGYRDMEEIAASPFLQDLAELDALRDLMRVRNKYRQLMRRFGKVFAEIDAVAAEIDRAARTAAAEPKAAPSARRKTSTTEAPRRKTRVMVSAR